MEQISLQELRKYAIERRTQILAVDSGSGRKFVVNNLGQVKIPDEDKDFRVEDALEAADHFEIGTGEKIPRLTRESLSHQLKEYFGKGAKAVHHDEDE